MDFSLTLTPQTIFAFLFLFLLSLLRTTFKNNKKRNHPPEAPGSWPLIGHLHLLRGPQPAHETLTLMADKLGPIFTIKLGVHRALVVSSQELARECLAANDKAFANRPKALASELMGYNYAVFGLSDSGPYWRRIRKIATEGFLANYRIQTLGHVTDSELRASVKETYDRIESSAEECLAAEMKRWFADATLNVVMRVVVGRRCDAASEIETDERCGRALREFIKLIGEFTVSDALPMLRGLDLDGKEKAMKEVAKELDVFLEGLLREYKGKRASGEVKGEHNNQDFMNMMMSALDGANDIPGTYQPDTINKATCLALIVGGTEPLTVTLTWALALLLNNRETLRKVQRELDEQVGRERQVRESDVKNLVYLQAVLKETLRLYPASSLSVPRESTEDCTVGGFHVPAGTRLLVNISRLHQDPNVWADPDEFRPDRFLLTHKHLDVGGTCFELMPFGSGRRVCPGISFSLQVTQLALAALLHGFHVATPTDDPVDMRGTVGLTNAKATPLHVILTPRLSAQAY